MDIGAYRIFILLALMLVLLCYQVSFHCAIIIMELAYLVMIPLSESVGILIMNLIYQGDIMTQVAEILLPNGKLILLLY